MKRINDIVKPKDSELIKVMIDGEEADACRGETVLTTLLAHGYRDVCKNDHGNITGAYCSMGICFLCCVRINGRSKLRSCQVYVKEGMVIETKSNFHFADRLNVYKGQEDNDG